MAQKKLILKNNRFFFLLFNFYSSDPDFPIQLYHQMITIQIPVITQFLLRQNLFKNMEMNLIRLHDELIQTQHRFHQLSSEFHLFKQAFSILLLQGQVINPSMDKNLIGAFRFGWIFFLFMRGRLDEQNMY